MSGIVWKHPAMLNLLWVLPGLVAMYIFAARRRRRAMIVFTSRPPDARALRRRRAEAALGLLAFGLLTVALARPCVHSQTERRSAGHDVVFLLDISRSMLAEDARPTRLEAAARTILGCVNRFAGERIALVVYAGTATLLCPLTSDYDFFRQALRMVSADSVTRGGTEIGAGIRFALDNAFDDMDGTARDLVLVGDGEDHGSGAAGQARAAGALGVRLIAAGYGDDARGSRIPSGTGYVVYDGAEVRSRRNDALLGALARATPGGAYLPEPSPEGLYRRVAAGIRRPEETLPPLIELYRAPLALAMLALCLDCVVFGMRRRSAARAALALACLGLSACRTPAAELPEGLFDAAVGHYRGKAYARAFETFGQAARAGSNPALSVRSRLNQAASALQLGIELAASKPQDALTWLDRSTRIYSECLRAQPSHREHAAWNLEVARLHIQALRKGDESQSSSPDAPPNAENPREILGAEAPIKPPPLVRAVAEKDW